MGDITNRKDGLIVRCYSDGKILSTVFGKETTYCPMNLKYFPFDKQTCHIEFMHPVRWGVNFLYEYNGIVYPQYTKEGIVFKTNFGAPSTALLKENEEWKLLNLTLKTEQLVKSIYTNSNVTYPTFEIIFELQRKPSFYVMILMLPSTLVTFISVIGFLLPSEAGEKVSLQLTSLLSYMLLALVVVDIIPPIGGNFPLIGKVYTL